MNTHRIPPKGFTLIELLIVIAIIAILVAVIWGAIGPRKAGAQTLGTQSQLAIFLHSNNIPYIWREGRGHLTILNSPNASRWATAVAACEELKAHEARLKTVHLAPVSEATEPPADLATAELQWGSVEYREPPRIGDDLANCL